MDHFLSVMFVLNILDLILDLVLVNNVTVVIFMNFLMHLQIVNYFDAFPPTYVSAIRTSAS